MSSITVTCQPRIAIENQRATLKSIWQSPEWQKESAAWKARHPPVCSRCGTEGPIVPGHTDEDYRDMPSYIQKVREDRVVPLCPRCNRNESKGKHPCPSCIEKHREDSDHWINYIGQGEERCRKCEPDHNPEQSKFRHEQGNRIKNRLTRQRYRAHHPVKKIVNGEWVTVTKKGVKV